MPHAPSITDYRRLEEELDDARETILQLMPAPARSILESYLRVPTREASYNWATEAAERVVSLVEDVSGSTYEGFLVASQRANCPLCGRGADSYEGIGYALPWGLTQHLLGNSRARQCPVFHAARVLARDHFNKRLPDGP